MFDTIVTSLIVTILGIGIIFYWLRKDFSKIYDWLSSLIQNYSALPVLAKDEVIKILFRVIRLNWYSVLMMVVLWFILFKVDVGSDIVVDYVDNISLHSVTEKLINRLGKFGLRTISLGCLFGSVLLMTLAIWAIPFFLFNPQREEYAKNDAIKFYIGTKLLSILAIMPFYIVANAFYFRNIPDEIPFWKILILSLGTILVLMFIEFRVLILPFIKNPLNKGSQRLQRWADRRLGGNRYFYILIQILIIEFGLIILTAALIPFFWADIHKLVSLFLLASSFTVFRLLFFTNDTRLTEQEVLGLVKEITGEKNRRWSKPFYISIIGFLLFFNGYYFLIPSLTATNTIYVVLCVFGLLIIYLDLFRNLSTNTQVAIKIIGYLGILAFLIAPVISPKGQFSIPLREYNGRVSEKTLQIRSIGKVDSLRLFNYAMERRLAMMNQDTTENIYVVCAMGGGSRAGYFTARVLQEIEKEIPNFWNQTLAYSTISGGSVGVYHHIKSKSVTVDSMFLKNIYLQNYNTSGAFGLLLGDSFEGAFGGLIGQLSKLVTSRYSTVRYRDRNVRIRDEYEYALQTAISGETTEGYINKTFRPHVSINNPDSFQAFFSNQRDNIPIHLINTFEISTGRRTIISPFIISDSTMFSNTIRPLQDTAFAKDIVGKDVTYREAVNISELFPFLSGASTIGEKCDFQFVDGGYFENYGLATGFDVVQAILSKHPNLKKRVKIILIKNSLQENPLPKKKRQLIAPLVGVINAPFTGHANHFRQEGKKIYGNNMVIVEFDSQAKDKKVPLTRALTKNHLAIMDAVAKAEVKIQKDSIKVKSQ